MAGLVTTLSLAELAAAGTGRLGVLAPPGVVPLAPRTQRELVQTLVSDVKNRFYTGTAPDGTKWRPLKYPRPRGGDKPLMDTGRLLASITGTADATSVTVGTAHPGAALQNAGGVVRPKRAKHLAIPLTKEAARAGSPRRMKGTAKVPLFARKVNGKWVGHWLLVKQVTVPARPFAGVSKEGERAVAAVLADAAARRWLAEGGGV